jgi:hypothetical protein
MANSTTAGDDKNIPSSEEGHEECLHGADAGIEGKAGKQFLVHIHDDVLLETMQVT